MEGNKRKLVQKFVGNVDTYLNLVNEMSSNGGEQDGEEMPHLKEGGGLPRFQGKKGLSEYNTVGGKIGRSLNENVNTSNKKNNKATIFIGADIGDGLYSDGSNMFEEDFKRMEEDLIKKYGAGNYQVVRARDIQDQMTKFVNKDKTPVDYDDDTYKELLKLKDDRSKIIEGEAFDAFKLDNPNSRWSKYDTMEDLLHGDFEDYEAYVNEEHYSGIFEDEEFKEHSVNLSDYLPQRRAYTNQEQAYKSLSSADRLKYYKSYFGNMGEGSDVIMLKHGDNMFLSNAGTLAEGTRSDFKYGNTPDKIDTFAEALTAWGPATTGTCYMGVCNGTPGAKHITNETGMTTKAQKGNWAGYYDRSGTYGVDQTFDEQFFNPQNKGNQQSGGYYNTYTKDGDDVETESTGYLAGMHDVAQNDDRQHKYGGSLPKAQNSKETLSEFCTNGPIVNSGGKVFAQCRNRDFDSKHDFTLGMGMSMGKLDDEFTGSFKGTGGYTWNPSMGTGGFKGYLGANYGGRATTDGGLNSNNVNVKPISDGVLTLGYTGEVGGNSYNWQTPTQYEFGLAGKKDLLGNDGNSLGVYGRYGIANANIMYNQNTGPSFGFGLGLPLREHGGSHEEEHYIGDGHDHSHDDLLKNVGTVSRSAISDEDIDGNGVLDDGYGNTYNTGGNDVVLNQNSDAKTYLTNDINSVGYDARWERELAMNKELGHYTDSENWVFPDGVGNSLGIHTKDYRLDNLNNVQEFLGRPKDYDQEDWKMNMRLNNRFFKRAAGVMLPSNKNQKYPRIYYGSNMDGDTNIPMGSDFSNLRTHELTHGITDGNFGMTDYASGLLGNAKTHVNNSDMSFKDWKANVNTEKKNSLISNVFTGSSPLTSNLKDGYNDYIRAERKKNSGNYLTDPSEVYARYKVAQNLMKDKGIFNSFTDTEFTEENYGKLEEYLNSDEYKELEDYDDVKEFFGTDKIRGGVFNKKISKGNIMEIMNNVADNSEIGGDDLQQGMFAKYGGSLTKAQNSYETLRDFEGVPVLSTIAAGLFPGIGASSQHNESNLGDLFRYYGGIPLEDDVITMSTTKPTKSKNPNADYISLNKNTQAVQEIIDNYNRVSNGDFFTSETRPDLILNKDDDERQIDKNNYKVTGYKEVDNINDHQLNAIGNYTTGMGEDENGTYISYYDVFDQAGGLGGSLNIGESLGLTKSFEIYDRIYVEKDKNSGNYILKKRYGGDSSSKKYIKHTIVKGDTGKRLKAMYGTELKDVLKHNNLKYFKMGAEIEIPKYQGSTNTSEVPNDPNNYILDAGILPEVKIEEKDTRSVFKKAYQDYISPIGHGVLDVAGMVPGFGEPFDLANAAWYTGEGNYVDAAFSSAAVLPFAGWAATTGKWTKNSVKAMDNVVDGGGDLFLQLKQLKNTHPKRMKDLKLNNSRRIKKLIKTDPERAQKIITSANVSSDVNFLTNVQRRVSLDANTGLNYYKDRTIGNILNNVDNVNIQSSLAKMGDDGVTSVYRYGETPLNAGWKPKNGWFSADPMDPFRYGTLRRLGDNGKVFKLDIPNSELSSLYRGGPQQGTGFGSGTQFKEFEIPDWLIEKTKALDLGSLSDYAKYLETLKKYGGSF